MDAFHTDLLQRVDDPHVQHVTPPPSGPLEEQQHDKAVAEKSIENGGAENTMTAGECLGVFARACVRACVRAVLTYVCSIVYIDRPTLSVVRIALRTCNICAWMSVRMTVK